MNFAVAEPPLKLVLIENRGHGGTINHLGVEVESSDTVHAEIARLTGEGLFTVRWPMRWSPRSTCDRATSWCWVRAPSRRRRRASCAAPTPSRWLANRHSFASIAPWAVTRREVIGTWHSALVSRPFQAAIRAQTSTYTARASLESRSLRCTVAVSCRLTTNSTPRQAFGQNSRIGRFYCPNDTGKLP